MKHFLFAITFAFALTAQADLKESFKKMEGITKGPFGLNYLQGSKGKNAIRESATTPPGGLLFQAAFRNDVARGMAENDSFFIGNLFTTNYHEIMGRFVYNDPYGSFPMDHQALAAQAPAASAFVAQMTRHWVLERSYTEILPHSKLAKSFRVRGISGSEFEFEYAKYYFNLGLAAAAEDFQFLPLYLLAKKSPLIDAAALDRARNSISQVYDSALAQYGPGNSLIRDLYAIRNAIHNQVSEDVIDRISSFLQSYPKFGRTLRDNLVKVQDTLRAYYNVGPAQIVKVAKEAGADEIKALASEIAIRGFDYDLALRLSDELVKVRVQLSDKTIAYENQTANLVLLATTSQYLNKELASMKNPQGKEPLLTVVNLLFVEGFLIKDNWNYFHSEIVAATDTTAASAILPDLIEIGTDTLSQAFEPALAQWMSIEPKMQYFIDNTIKASSLNTAAYLAKEVK